MLLDDAHGRVAERQSSEIAVPLWRLYTLRICYLILAGGLGLYIWPSVVEHTAEFAAAQGVRSSLLAGLGATDCRQFLRNLPNERSAPHLQRS